MKITGTITFSVNNHDSFEENKDAIGEALEALRDIADANISDVTVSVKPSEMEGELKEL